MISAIISRIVILLFGTLYPAYASYKAVRTKNVKEYVKWMMYWIVFAFFSFFETITDIFLSWFPFYYEVKVILVLWLLSPATKGSSTLYRKFVHPMLTRREQDIDEYITQAKEKGYTAVLQLGSKGVNYATNVIMQTAIKGGGNLVQTLRKSYSLSDLSEPDILRTQDEVDEIVRPANQRILRSRTQSTRSVSGGRNDMYFPEVDVAKPREAHGDYSYIRSSEDISSGYSSAEPMSVGLSRTASLTNTTRARVKAKKTEETVLSEGREMESITNLPYPYLLYHNSNYYPISSESDEIFFFKENQKKIVKQLEGERGDVDTLNSIEEMKDEEFFANEQYFAENQKKHFVEEDTFKDTISIESTEDEFLETETEELPINLTKLVLPKVEINEPNLITEMNDKEKVEIPKVELNLPNIKKTVIETLPIMKEELALVQNSIGLIKAPMQDLQTETVELPIEKEETSIVLVKAPLQDNYLIIDEIPVSSTSSDSLNVSKNNLASSRNSLISLQGSSSDLTKRSISHKKGKAPPPPLSPQTPLIFDTFKETSI